MSILNNSTISERVLEEAIYTITYNATVRKTAKQFGVCKSTVHRDLTKRLPMEYPNLAEDVKVVLEKNKAERHIRGGRATKIKFSKE